jgi:hypothetical protein
MENIWAVDTNAIKNRTMKLKKHTAYLKNMILAYSHGIWNIELSIFRFIIVNDLIHFETEKYTYQETS